jgi:threonine/homoserine/homoserine lactone efflux protein
VHAALTVEWFALLIGAASLLSRGLRRPGTVRALDGVTGATLVGFGMRPALSAR